MGAEIIMPEVGPLAYLLELCIRMKIATPGDYGPQARTWAEVLAFSEATGVANEYWERQALFDMSWDYVDENQRATSPFLKPPMERL